MRKSLLIVAALAALAIVPGAASAATVTLEQNGNLLYQAAPGEDNDLEIRVTALGYVAFDEQSITITPGQNCHNPFGVDSLAWCLPQGTEKIRVYAGNGTNVVTADTAFPAFVDGFGATANTFVGGPADDDLGGGSGDDELDGGSGNDELDGRSGNDELNGGEGADSLQGGFGNDRVDGGTGADEVQGGVDDDELDGEDGDDRLLAGAGSDELDGGAGTDTADYSIYAASVTVDLDGVPDDGQAGEADTVGTDVESIVGSSAGDILTGNAAANELRGGAGNDTIDGGPGADGLFGEEGDDSLLSIDGVPDTDDCGAGADSFSADPSDTLIGCETNAAAGGGQPGQPGQPTQPAGQPTQPAGQPTQPAGQPTQPAGQPTQPGGPLMRISPARLRLDRRGYATLRVSCPGGAAGACRGTLRLQRRVAGSIRRVGRGRFSIAPGRAAAVKIRIPRRLRHSIARRSLRVSAVARAQDASSAARTTRRGVTLMRFAAPRNRS